MWMGDAVRIRISTTEQIKASAGDDAARAAPGGTAWRRRAATHPTHPIPPSLSCNTCGRFEKIDRRSRIGGLKPMGALRHDLHRAFSADARHGGAEPRGDGGAGDPNRRRRSRPTAAGATH